jgi:hypothetical protein
LELVRKTNWSRRLPHSITPLDGPPLTELRDVAQYMLGIGDRHHRRAWQRAAALLLGAAERNGSVDAARGAASARGSSCQSVRLSVLSCRRVSLGPVDGQTNKSHTTTAKLAAIIAKHKLASVSSDQSILGVSLYRKAVIWTDLNQSARDYGR